MNAWVERQATTAPRFRASSSPMALSRCVLPRPLFPTNTSGLYFLPGCSSTALAHPGRRLLRFTHALRIAEYAVARGLGIELGDFGLERLESLHVVRELGDRGVDRGGRLLLEQRLEPLRAVALPLPTQHRLRHAGPPRLDRLPDRDGDVGEERPEFVGPPRPPRPPPPPPPPPPRPTPGG